MLALSRIFTLSDSFSLRNPHATASGHLRRLVILISGRGSNMEAVARAYELGLVLPDGDRDRP